MNQSVQQTDRAVRFSESKGSGALPAADFDVRT